MPTTALVHRLQRHANIHGLAEWRQAQVNFTRFAEPAGVGTATGRSIDHKQQANAPPSVAPLYAAMRGAWNYKQSNTGRQAHTSAGAQPSQT